MKKTIIALMALAGVAVAAEKTTKELTFADFNTELAGVSAFKPSEYTLTLTFTGTDFNNYGSGFLLKLADNWGVFTQAGAYIAMENTNTNDRTWVTPTSTSGTTFTWTSTDTTTDSLLDSWVSKDTNGNQAQPGVNGMTFTLAVTSSGSTITLGMTNGTISVIETGYVVNLANIELQDGSATNDPNQGVTSISNASITYTPTVPEPATATLSLLALAGLAVRRRRK
ncbi:MAG: PEP-CTERM sorting domain-containing protein [Akkermansia sp.]|nr:PEP-CTERM sorting domain-containing protein [Akkermansia sp.]